MPSDARHHHHDPEDPGAFVHRSRHLLLPLAAIAAALTALHARGLAFAVGGVAAWLMAVTVLMVAASHDWRACSLCDRPPPYHATPEARARLARRHHAPRLRRQAHAVLIGLLLLHALLPKPYMRPWWTVAPAAACYLLVAYTVARFALTYDRHRMYREECHVEWCRAGMDRPPRNRPVSMWIGHHGLWMVAVLAPAVCALGLLAQRHPVYGLQGGYAVALLALAFVVLEMILGHADRPCLLCARLLPSNGGEAAERRHPWLRRYHRLRSGLLGAAAVTVILSWVTAGTTLAKALVCASALTVVAWAVLDRIHAPVRPWCPWCRDDDGDDATVPTPDPSTNVPSPA